MLAFNVFFWTSTDGQSRVFGLAVVLLFGGVTVTGVPWCWLADSSCWSPGGAPDGGAHLARSAQDRRLDNGLMN
jgi:hypothetical protein